MNPSDKYYAEWLKQKRERRAPEGFADQIMKAIEREDVPSTSERLRFLSKIGKVAVFVMAAALGVGRYGVLLFCLLY